MTQKMEQLLWSFESIKNISQPDGYEYWSARDLQKVLGYTKWENFSWVILKAKTSCKEAWNIVEEHFPESRKPSVWGQWAVQEVLNYNLSRYACYLIAQNGDSKKSEIRVIRLFKTGWKIGTQLSLNFTIFCIHLKNLYT